MGKNDLIKAIAEATGITQLEVQTVVDAWLELIARHIARGERVTIKGFGSFFLRHRPSRIYIHPETGKPEEAPPAYVPVFHPSSSFRQYIAELRNSESQ